MATTEHPLTLTLDAHGTVDRRAALAAFADGREITPVYGPDRPLVAASLEAHLRGIIPSRGDVIRHAFGYGNDRAIRAYRNGRAYLRDAYWGYGCSLPSLDSPELPED